ncbi:MAG: branched-chain amino acid ABC transporter permease [Candidatus Vogelbacteria bacterium]|nr:branched-chain amino acid ABC transporter permease [Candidatus Vogelbacteria bacterium]
MDIVPQLVANSVIAGALYALLALGFNFLYRTVKFFDLSYGAIAATGGYTVFALSKLAGLSIWLAAPAGVLAGALLAWLINLTIYRPLRARRASNLVLLVAALGVMTILQAALAIIFSSQFQTLSASLSTVVEIAGGVYTVTQLVILAAALLTFVALHLLKRTRLGKSIEAVADDVEVARITGLKVERITSAVVLTAGAIAGLAGILVGFDTGLEPTMGLALLLKAVIAAIVGGLGTAFGALFGGFLLGAVENFGIWQFSGEWKDAIAFMLLIVFLVFRPQGLVRR